MFNSMLNIASRVKRLFRIFGQSEFIRRLHDFLLHEGRRSRAQTLEQTAKAVLDLEKAEALRIKNSRSLLDLMTAAGFSEEKIQATLSNPQEMQRVSIALTALLQYVDKGVITVSMVTTPIPSQQDKVNDLKPFQQKIAMSQAKLLQKKKVGKRIKKGGAAPGDV